MKQLFEKQRGSWALLVDQRPIAGLDAKLKDKMLALYGYAIKRGMICSARLVQSTHDARQLAQLVDSEAELKQRVRVFTERYQAYDWLREMLRAAT